MQTSESRQTNSEFLQFQGANPQLSVPPYTGQSLHAWRLQFPFEGLAPLVDLAPGHGNARLVHAGEHPGRSPTFLDYIYIISICALYIYIYLFCVQSSVLVFHLRFCFRIFETVRQSVFGNLLQSGCPSLCTVREISGGVNGGK